MTLTYDRVKQVADEVILLSDRTRQLISDIQSFLIFNSHLSIDWGAAEKPSYIEEDRNNNLAGYVFSRQEVSNIIGSFYWLNQLMTKQPLIGGEGDHLGNINKIAEP